MSQLTKKAIKASFVKLLNERSLDKITVKDIVEDCGINRNTFYYYYQDIYALLEEVFLDETQEVLEGEYRAESWQEGIIHAVDFALANKKAVFHVYNSRSKDELSKYLDKTIGWVVRQYVENQKQGLCVDEEDVRLVTLFYQKAIMGILLDWVEKGMKVDPVESLHKLGELFEGNVRLILERVSK